VRTVWLKVGVILEISKCKNKKTKIIRKTSVHSAQHPLLAGETWGNVGSGHRDLGFCLSPVGLPFALHVGREGEEKTQLVQHLVLWRLQTEMHL